MLCDAPQSIRPALRRKRSARRVTTSCEKKLQKKSAMLAFVSISHIFDLLIEREAFVAIIAI
jgi:hypothetical protein